MIVFSCSGLLLVCYIVNSLGYRIPRYHNYQDLQQFPAPYHQPNYVDESQYDNHYYPWQIHHEINFPRNEYIQPPPIEVRNWFYHDESYQPPIQQFREHFIKSQTHHQYVPGYLSIPYEESDIKMASELDSDEILRRNERIYYDSDFENCQGFFNPRREQQSSNFPIRVDTGDQEDQQVSNISYEDIDELDDFNNRLETWEDSLDDALQDIENARVDSERKLKAQLFNDDREEDDYFDGFLYEQQNLNHKDIPNVKTVSTSLFICDDDFRCHTTDVHVKTSNQNPFFPDTNTKTVPQPTMSTTTKIPPLIIVDTTVATETITSQELPTTLPEISTKATIPTTPVTVLPITTASNVQEPTISVTRLPTESVDTKTVPNILSILIPQVDTAESFNSETSQKFPTTLSEMSTKETISVTLLPTTTASIVQEPTIPVWSLPTKSEDIETESSVIIHPMNTTESFNSKINLYTIGTSDDVIVPAE